MNHYESAEQLQGLADEGLRMVTWLRAQLDDDERIANAALAAKETGIPSHLDDEGRIVIGDRAVNVHATAHIIRHGPARVLAEVAAKREVVSYFAPTLPELTEQQLHAQQWHPDYEYETTTGQRKAWDDADRPPDGDGWERNVDRGDQGWERFDYHEEAYWRRLRPGGREPARYPWVLRLLTLAYADRPGYRDEWKPA